MNITAQQHDDEATASGLTTGKDTQSDALVARAATQWRSPGTVVGPVLFTLAWMVLGWLRPGYSPVS